MQQAAADVMFSAMQHKIAKHATLCGSDRSSSQSSEDGRFGVEARMAADDRVRRTVYVSDIDADVTESELASTFEACGDVVDCRMCGDANSALRFAFIEFGTTASALKALRLSGTMLKRCSIRVLHSKTAIEPVNAAYYPRSAVEMDRCARTVYVANIDKRVGRDDVCNFFETLCEGKVACMRLLGDRKHATRIAFLEFDSSEGARRALNCSGALLGTLPVRVSPSKTPVRVNTGSASLSSAKRRAQKDARQSNANAARSKAAQQAQHIKVHSSSSSTQQAPQIKFDYSSVPAAFDVFDAQTPYHSACNDMPSPFATSFDSLIASSFGAFAQQTPYQQQQQQQQQQYDGVQHAELLRILQLLRHTPVF